MVSDFFLAIVNNFSCGARRLFSMHSDVFCIFRVLIQSRNSLTKVLNTDHPYLATSLPLATDFLQKIQVLMAMLGINVRMATLVQCLPDQSHLVIKKKITGLHLIKVEVIMKETESMILNNHFKESSFHTDLNLKRTPPSPITPHLNHINNPKTLLVLRIRQIILMEINIHQITMSNVTSSTTPSQKRHTMIPNRNLLMKDLDLTKNCNTSHTIMMMVEMYIQIDVISLRIISSMVSCCQILQY